MRSLPRSTIGTSWEFASWVFLVNCRSSPPSPATTQKFSWEKRTPRPAPRMTPFHATPVSTPMWGSPPSTRSMRNSKNAVPRSLRRHRSAFLNVLWKTISDSDWLLQWTCRVRPSRCLGSSMFSFLKRKLATHCIESRWSGLTRQHDGKPMIMRRYDSLRHATNTVLASQFHCVSLTGTVCLRRTSQTSPTK